ncbi:MAG TPA: phosphoenolpyruvate--protein phosphotransferase [Armatimonadota bacterium]|jgi:fructose-specific PTS system IIA-like component
MACEHSFQFPLEHGLHARPASVLRDAADAHSADIRFINHRNGIEANAKSVLSLIAADVHLGDPCSIIVEGDDERSACDALAAFLTDVFPGCDEPLPAPSIDESGTAQPPRVVASSGATFIRGLSACPGVVEAPAFVLEAEPLPDVPDRADSPDREKAIFDMGLDVTASDMVTSLERVSNPTEADVLKAHLAILRDPEFRDRVNSAIASGCSAGGAIIDVQTHYTTVLGTSESAYLRERAMDVRDVSSQLLRRLYPDASRRERPAPSGPHILVAQDLTPSEFLSQDKALIAGIVLSEGGITSHTVILARAAGIPCVVGARNAHRLVSTGVPMILDARRGLVLPEPPEAVSRYYRLEQKRARRRREQLEIHAGAPGRTADGRPVEVSANASSAEEAEAAFMAGAEGIGLFRTELLFMDRSQPPTEEEQFTVYSRLVTAAKGRPVIIRTLDVGGDKPVPYLSLPEEPNPFLGYRAVRFYPDHEDLLATQLRAILRAAALGPVRVMAPMISCVEEVRYVRALVGRVAEGLVAAGQAHGAVEIGIMIEVPSAAMIVDALAVEAEFFSIGTNDLAQYLMAVDRGNRKIGKLAGMLHPALLRTLTKIVDDAHAAGRWVGMCGEMAGVERLAPVLVGLGLDELSMAGPNVTAMKAALGKWRTDECRAMLEAASKAPTATDADAIVTAFSPAGEKPGVLDAAIVNLESEARSRDEAIKELVDLLSLDGRIGDPNLVEEAIWRREDEYSTGVGYGFAIPHCKSKDVTVNSIGFLKLNEPIEWQTLDDEPVRVVLMLAIREADHGTEHLRIFAQLARKIMDDDFRERLLTENDTVELVRFIQSEIE